MLGVLLPVAALLVRQPCKAVRTGAAGAPAMAKTSKAACPCSHCKGPYSAQGDRLEGMRSGPGHRKAWPGRRFRGRPRCRPRASAAQRADAPRRKQALRQRFNPKPLSNENMKP